MSSRDKGNSTERKALEYYTRKGWLIDRATKTGKFRKHKDLFSNTEFNGFDLVGVKRGYTVFVQCKTNNPPVLGPYKQFASEYASEHVIIEAAVWYDRRGWVFYTFKPDGSYERRDERK